MFAKLLKMEFRSTWNVLGILCLSLVGAGLLGGLATRYLEGASAPKQWLEILCVLVITAAVLFFVVCGAAALIVQIVRFYRSRFTDEGYRHHPSDSTVQLYHQRRQSNRHRCCRSRQLCFDGAVRRAGF